MKNRKNLFVLAIVALILVLGVGYAVVSSTTLTINGTGTAKQNELNVVYDGVNTNSSRVTAISAPDGSKDATFTITDMVKDAVEYAEFEIKNKETDVDATINFPTTNTNSNSSFFQYKLFYNDTEWTSGTKTLAAQGTAKIKVQVTLTGNPVSSADSTTTITVSYTAEPAQATP